MLFGRRSFHARLVFAFAGITSALVLVAALIALFWLSQFQRTSMRDALRTPLAMVAMQSQAALQTNDLPRLSEQLNLLARADSIRWAVVLRDGIGLVHFGRVPADLLRVDNDLRAAGGVLWRFNRLIIGEPIVAGKADLGMLIAEVDVSDLNIRLGIVALAALFLMGVLLLLALPVFHRLVRTVSDPLAQLARLSQVMTSIGKAGGGGTAENSPVSSDDVGRLGHSLNQMVDAIVERDHAMQRSRDELRALTARLQAVREEERTRIAREIHDELGQRLTAIKLDVARLLGSSGEDGIRLAAMLDETVKTVRDISWELRPSVLDALGLTAAIDYLAEDFQRRMATRCRVELPEQPPPVDGEIATHLFRICQELLTNVARHARASRVDIRFLAEGNTLQLEVTDNGVGIHATGAEHKSLGLLGIRERVHCLGGQLVIESAPDIEGTRVRVSVPVSSGRAAA